MKPLHKIVLYGLAGIISFRIFAYGYRASNKSMYDKLMNETLNSNGKQAVLLTEPLKNRWSGEITNTNVYLAPKDEERKLLFKTKPFLQDILVCDFNRDATDDFILYFDDCLWMHAKDKLNTASERILEIKPTISAEMYMSTGKDFEYRKVN